MTEAAPQETIAALLRRLTDPAGGERLTLDDAIETLGDRAFGLALLMLALPMAVPISAIPGISTIFGIPLIFISAQLMLGHPRPWLPAWLGAKSLSRADLGRMIDKALPWLERCERYVKPRLPMLVSPVAERVIGGVAAFMAVIMALPIVLGNQPPAIAIAFLAVAVIEKDGVFTIVGLATAVAATALVAAVLSAFAAAFWLAVNALLT